MMPFTPAVRLALRQTRRNVRRRFKETWLALLLIALSVAVGVYVSIAHRTVSGLDLTSAQTEGFDDVDALAIIEVGVLFGSAGASAIDGPQRAEQRQKLERTLATLEDNADTVLATWTWRSNLATSSNWPGSEVVAGNWTDA
jgi:hypothetical protein